MVKVLPFVFARELAETDPQSGLRVLRGYKRHVTLPWHFFGRLQKGIKLILDRCLNYYSRSLEGVPVAYSDVQAVRTRVPTIRDQVEMHFDLILTMVLFKPKAGDILKGTVQMVDTHGIQCLVHDAFNARLSMKGVSKAVTPGDVVNFRVTRVSSSSKLISIHGRLIDSHRSFGDLQAPPPDVILPDIVAHCHRRFAVEQPGDGSEDNTDILSSSGKKSKKKGRHVTFDGDETVGDDFETVDSKTFEEKQTDLDPDLEAFASPSSTRKKKKKHKHKEHEDSEVKFDESGIHETVMESSSEGFHEEKLPKRSKKSTRRESEPEPGPNESGISESGLNFCDQPSTSKLEQGESDLTRLASSSADLPKKLKKKKKKQEREIEVKGEVQTDAECSTPRIEKPKKGKKRKFEDDQFFAEPPSEVKSEILSANEATAASISGDSVSSRKKHKKRKIDPDISDITQIDAPTSKLNLLSDIKVDPALNSPFLVPVNKKKQKKKKTS